MREMSHRLVISFERHHKKCWKRPVLPIRRTERVSSVTKKWKHGRPRTHRGASTDPIKKGAQGNHDVHKEI
jgi:hypothetical protein